MCRPDLLLKLPENSAILSGAVFSSRDSWFQGFSPCWFSSLNMPNALSSYSAFSIRQFTSPKYYEYWAAAITQYWLYHLSHVIERVPSSVLLRNGRKWTTPILLSVKLWLCHTTNKTNKKWKLFKCKSGWQYLWRWNACNLMIFWYIDKGKMCFDTRVFFTRKSARFYAFRNKSTPSTALPSMLARTKICKCTRSDYRLFALALAHHLHDSVRLFKKSKKFPLKSIKGS